MKETRTRRAGDALFEERLSRCRDELEWLFMELYDDREALGTLEQAMADAFAARSADLKKLDAAREADPGWYRRGNMFGMTMYTDLFAGDLKKLAKKLPYLKEQKLTYLHLMPLLKMPHPTTTAAMRWRTSTRWTRPLAPSRPGC